MATLESLSNFAIEILKCLVNQRKSDQLFKAGSTNFKKHKNSVKYSACTSFHFFKWTKKSEFNAREMELLKINIAIADMFTVNPFFCYSGFLR